MQKLTRSLAMAGALAFAGLLAGCGDDVTVNPDRRVTLTPPNASIKVGDAVTFSATVSGLSNTAVTWASDNQAVATVDANGKATAVSVGTATITATATADAAVKASAVLTVTGSGVTAVVVSPNAQILKPGEFIQATANVTADPGVARTVTWSSSATAVATVDATGKVTAVSEGPATITAASTVDPSVTGSMALTVRPLQQAQVSIQAVTKGGTNQPVNFNNVSGQIDVVLNVDPGDETVTSVSVNVDGQAACTRALSGSESQALRLAAAFPNVASVEAVDVVCSINTAEFDTEDGSVSFLNGAHTLSASAEVAGPPARTITSSAQPATFNNQSGFIALVSNTNTVGGPASAINPENGLKYVQGDVTLTLAAVNYTAGGATVTSVNGTFLGQAFSSNSPTGQVFTFTFAADDELEDYETPLGSAESIPVVTSSSLSSGNQGPTQILNVGAGADDLGLTRLDSTRVDNVIPEEPTVGDFPAWVTQAFEFEAEAAGITDVEDTGVNGVNVEFYVIKGDLPDEDACDVTGMTLVTTAEGLTESLSTEWNGKVVITDLLGNKRCVDFGNAFGADFGAPEDVELDGVANMETFTSVAGAAATNYTINTAGDTLSGLPAANPALISIVRRGQTSADNDCVIGDAGTFPTCDPIPQPETGSITGGESVMGYYTITAQMRDSAGNVGPEPALTATYVVDEDAPTFTGGLTLAQTYSGNATATISGITVNDNLDLLRLLGQVNYTAAGVNIEYASQTIGSFGFDELTKTFSGTYSFPNLIRCIAPAGAGPYAANNANKASDITLFAYDVAGNFGTKLPTPGDFAPRVDDCGDVGNLTGSFVLSAFDQNAPSYGTGNTQVDIDGEDVDDASATSVSLSAASTVSTNASNPFTRVEFYWLNPETNGYVLIGQATASAGPNTSPTRNFNYSLSWNPDATIPVGSVTVIAIGIDAQGDAVVTGTQTVTTVE